MYFPRSIDEFGDFLSNLRWMSTSEKLRVIDDALNAMSYNARSVDPGVLRMLHDYRMSLNDLERGEERRDYRRLEERNRHLEEEVSRLLQELDGKEQLLSYIRPTIESYKNLYIFLLSHPKNKSCVTTEILSRINYLDKMTRDVVFVMPGYQRAKENDVLVDVRDPNMQLTFDESLFMSIVQRLEDESCGAFAYDDRCELLILGAKEKGEFDYSSLARLDLDMLSNKRGIDAIRLIINVSHRFRQREDYIDIKKSVNEILGELTMIEESPAVRVFIAGAKELKEERALLREELSKIENTLNLDIRALTFEDFAASLTGSETTRQDHYNEFIKNKADVTVFIFDKKVGDITMQEFDVAYEALKSSRRPEIFVYSRNRGPWFRIGESSKLKSIREKVFGANKEYYVEYDNNEELRYLFHTNMIKYFKESQSK
jgi:hypothetical protein